MNFLPAIPQITQQNQGIGYGNWQQYAGYGKDNSFGGEGGIAPPSSKGVAPTTDNAKSFGDFVSKKINNFTNGVSDFAKNTLNNATTAYNEASQGNGYLAIKALSGNNPNSSNNAISDDVVGNASGMDPIDKR